MKQKIHSVGVAGLRNVESANVTIYLPRQVLDRCRAVAVEEKRSLSNYLAGLLERAHPPTVPRQVDLEDAIAAVKRGPRSAKHK